ncbi:mitochondrial ribosomal protein L22 [Halictus rubicundus]|uniref:mitochondrial ribosomal protein L22 n=1 Tax=Halictus rubicundus TaxID=77578 RepID=UPI004035EFBB
MQCIRQNIRLVSNKLSSVNVSNCLFDAWEPVSVISSRNIHGSSPTLRDFDGPVKFLEHNKTIFPPQKPGEERRPGYVCHVRANIKYSPLKMWYVACLIRGMTVDEAIKQLSFLQKKGGHIVKEIILEAQRMAVEEHNIEFKSNLWVAESFATKGIVIKGIRRHAKGRVGEVRYKHCHYFVRLEEGKPPKDYYLRNPPTGEEMLENYMTSLKQRKVHNSL